MAHSCHFIQRKGKIDGYTFLSLIVFNTNSLFEESLNDLTIDLQKNHAIAISKQALHERFNEKSVLFITSALEKLLNKQLQAKVKFRDCDEFKRFLIKDSVCFQVDESLVNDYPGSGGGGSKANVRIQFEYKARAALNLFITSAPTEFIDIDTAWKIYTLRWQIELTFKIWKSICKIDKVKKIALNAISGQSC